MPVQIVPGHDALGFEEARLCGSEVTPHCRALLGLADMPLCMEMSQLHESRRMIGTRCLPEQSLRARKILAELLPSGIEHTQSRLRFRVAGLRRSLQPHHAGLQITGDTLAAQVEIPEPKLGSWQALIRRPSIQ